MPTNINLVTDSKKQKYLRSLKGPCDGLGSFLEEALESYSNVLRVEFEEENSFPDMFHYIVFQWDGKSGTTDTVTNVSQAEASITHKQRFIDIGVDDGLADSILIN